MSSSSGSFSYHLTQCRTVSRFTGNVVCSRLQSSSSRWRLCRLRFIGNVVSSPQANTASLRARMVPTIPAVNTYILEPLLSVWLHIRVGRTTRRRQPHGCRTHGRPVRDVLRGMFRPATPVCTRSRTTFGVDFGSGEDTSRSRPSPSRFVPANSVGTRPTAGGSLSPARVFDSSSSLVTQRRTRPSSSPGGRRSTRGAMRWRRTGGRTTTYTRFGCAQI